MSGTADRILSSKNITNVNVRRVNIVNPFTQLQTTVALPAETPSESAENNNNMYKRQLSSPVYRTDRDLGYLSESESQHCSQNKTTKKKPHPKKHRTFRVTVGDSIVSSTSLIMASSSTVNVASHMERKFLRGSFSMENLWFRNQEYPFENLVFEGGGCKGMAYVGALQVLEEMNILKNIKRFAGASVGAMVATLAAIGFTSSELQEFLDQDLRKIMVDHSCGYCSLIPNLLKGFGWNPGKKLTHWFGKQLEERTGDYDITFKEILRLFGTEICIVVTNLSHMSVEYFHPKTTPNTPVRKAVQMSMALPGVFQVVRETFNGQEDVYVDGGLLCNYPIHAFDGWWLSMHPEDSFYNRLQPMEDFASLYEKSQRFGTWNSKTLGIVLYSHTETELMKVLLSARPGSKPPVPPSTKLSKQRLKMKRKQQQRMIEHEHMVHVVGRFMKELHRNNLNEDSIINKEEFRAVFDKPVFLLPDDLHLLFGENCQVMEAFAQLDIDDDGEITFHELMAFLEKRGVNLQTRFLGYARREINHLGDFVQTLQAALAVNVKRIYVEKRDVERTIGIDTDYIESNDFNLELADKLFLIESGNRATRAFLCDYIKRKNQTDYDPVSPSEITVQPESNKSTFDYESRPLSSASSTTSSYRSIATIEIE